MAMVRPAIALDARCFGRRGAVAANAAPVRSSMLHSDLRLFAVTFAAGFLFVSILIG